MDDVELVARAIASAKMGLDNLGERLPDDLWMQADEQAQRALTALRSAGWQKVGPDMVVLRLLFVKPSPPPPGGQL